MILKEDNIIKTPADKVFKKEYIIRPNIERIPEEARTTALQKTFSQFDEALEKLDKEEEEFFNEKN